MKQRFLIVVIGGFIAYYVVQYLSYLLQWYISADGGTIYDYAQMVIYFAAGGAALFSVALILSVILVHDKITNVSCFVIGLTTITLAVISTIIGFVWGHFFVQEIVQSNNIFNNYWVGELVIVHVPFMVTILICILGVRYVVSKNS